jgi:hypothetical protein
MSNLRFYKFRRTGWLVIICSCLLASSVALSRPGKRRDFAGAALMAARDTRMSTAGSGRVPRPHSFEPVALHKYYTSIMHAEYNAETKSLEVSARIFADDLEQALAKRNKKNIHLETGKNAGAQVLAYLQDTFQLKDAKGEIKKLSWVGMETKVDVVWVYFEIKLPEGLAGAQLRNRLLFELFPEQVNVVQYVDGKRKIELVFKQDSDFQAIAPNS